MMTDSKVSKNGQLILLDRLRTVLVEITLAIIGGIGLFLAGFLYGIMGNV